MAIVNQVDKKTLMNKWDIVKYQILTHCFLYKIQVSESDLNCLTLLAMEGEQELTAFCDKVHGQNIFSSPQSVRNCLSKAAKKNLIVKEGRNKKKITINPIMNIESGGNILLNYKFLSVASPQGQGTNS